MKCWFITVLLCAISFLVWAQPASLYSWEKNRERIAVAAKEADAAEMILKQHYQYDYVLENDQFVMYSTIHRIVRVNNNEAIQKHNRIVISMNNTIELTELKARAINREGKAVHFDKSNLKELKEEESGNAYRIFAIEGVEMDSEIEYYFTRRMRASVFDRVFMQYEAPVKETSFVLTCPDHLRFDFKTYHGFPAVVQDSVKGSDINQYHAGMSNVPALKREPFSSFDSNRKRIEFKLAYNTARSPLRMYTWDEAAKTFYAMLTEMSKEDEKALDKFVKTLGDNPSQETAARIRHIEQRIKTAVTVNMERRDDAVSMVGAVIKSKVASREGITKLFLAVFSKVGIACRPVITCSREQIRFDGAFDSWSFLDDYLLYFPETKGFVAPYVFEMRYPLVPPGFTAQQALFIEPFKVGERQSALASVDHIPAADYSVNTDDMDIDVVFAGDLSTAQVRHQRTFGGYNASFFVPYYDLMTQEQRSKMIEELTRQVAPDATVKDWTAKLLPDPPVARFSIDVNYETSHFMEKAGPRVLFKVGELIGPQVEMYRDEERLTEVENEFNRGYDRVIRLHIPDGYAVRNAQDLKMDIAYKEKGKTPFVFQSDYIEKDNLLEVTIREYYKEIYAPVSRYEDFRKVINAAADFNKVTLVLEKR